MVSNQEREIVARVRYVSGTLLLFVGIEGIPMCALFFPLDFEGKIH